jgi:chemotaxis protein MotB
VAAVDPSRMTRVTGHADRTPATVDPMDVRNNRMEVILLRSGQAERRRF